MSSEVSVVTAAYQAILLREPDPLGLDCHVQMLHADPSGRSVITSLLESVEYRERLMPTRALAIMPCYDFQVIAPTGDWMLGGLERGEDYEPYVIEAFREACRGGRVLDVGANIGIFSMVAAKVTSADVVSVEVSQFNAKLVIANCRLNQLENVTVLPFAASDRLGVAKFHTTRDLNKVLADPVIDKNTIENIDVALSAPLDLMIDHPVDVIKIDIEGHEHLAFEGARRLLSSKPKIFVEFSPEFIFRGCGVAPEVFFQKFDELGYSATILHRDMTRENAGMDRSRLIDAWQVCMARNITHLDLMLTP